MLYYLEQLTNIIYSLPQRHPLHLACLCHCPSTIASTVLNAYPEAAAIADSSEEQYPLHIAALHGANGTLLQRLYNCYPDAIKARTKSHGWLPLHLACHKDATPGAVRVLLEFYPEAVKVRCICLFLLMCLVGTHGIVLYVIKIGGKCCGSLPLHIASRNGCNAEILKMLFEVYPEALEKKDSSGATPYGAGHVSLS